MSNEYKSLSAARKECPGSSSETGSPKCGAGTGNIRKQFETRRKTEKENDKSKTSGASGRRTRSKVKSTFTIQSDLSVSDNKSSEVMEKDDLPKNKVVDGLMKMFDTPTSEPLISKRPVTRSTRPKNGTSDGSSSKGVKKKGAASRNTESKHKERKKNKEGEADDVPSSPRSPVKRCHAMKRDERVHIVRRGGLQREDSFMNDIPTTTPTIPLYEKKQRTPTSQVKIQVTVATPESPNPITPDVPPVNMSSSSSSGSLKRKLEAITLMDEPMSTGGISLRKNKHKVQQEDLTTPFRKVHFDVNDYGGGTQAEGGRRTLAQLYDTPPEQDSRCDSGQ